MTRTPEGSPAGPQGGWCGAVLAGGRSRRFGRDKALARLAGRRLIDLALASHADADTVYVVLGAPERAAALAPSLPAHVTALPDDRPGLGPMGGLATVLARHPRDWVAVQAVDLPLLPPAWWPRLAACHRRGTLAVVPRDADGRWEPLAALYHGSLGAELAGMLTPETPTRTSLQPWLDAAMREGRVTAVAVSALPAGALRNVNRPADAEAAAAALRAARSRHE
ncbi:MAG: molybdenum cofactor guanylyltransferase [Trueperaceae bacterium]|nr:molybdenum cofactor guanylyltransferase [Trueperaceae bacterium]